MLLSTLSSDACKLMCPHLRLVYLHQGAILCKPDIQSEYAYFPLDCFISLNRFMEDGSSVSVALVGKEGVIGICHLLGGKSMPYTAVNQTSGYALQVRSDALTEAFNRSEKFRESLLLYVQALVAQIGLNAACNRHHTLSDQLARLLLLIADRLPTNEINLTQENLASLLGVRRERINRAAVKLQDEGKISYGRGRVKILDLEKLSRQSCNCHETIRTEFDRLLTIEPDLDPCDRIADLQKRFG